MTVYRLDDDGVTPVLIANGAQALTEAIAASRVGHVLVTPTGKALNTTTYDERGI